MIALVTETRPVLSQIAPVLKMDSAFALLQLSWSFPDLYNLSKMIKWPHYDTEYNKDSNRDKESCPKSFEKNMNFFAIQSPIT